MRDVQVDISACRSGTAVQRLLVDRLDGLTGYARVTVAGELQPDIDLVLDDLRSVSHSLDALLVRFGHLHIAYDVDSIAGQATVEGQFVRDVLASDLDEAEKQRVIATGLRALSSRADLEVA